MNTTTRKICQECNLRPIGGGKSSGYEDASWAQQYGYCLPCADKGQMDISHINNHDGIPEAECWFCHPELDETMKEYTVRAGTSRTGMIITVPIRADGVVKAAVTFTSLTGVKIEGNTTRKIQAEIKANGGKLVVAKDEKWVTLLLGSLQLDLNWDYRGRFVSGTLAGRKVRNVAEALRLAV